MNRMLLLTAIIVATSLVAAQQQQPQPNPTTPPSTSTPTAQAPNPDIHYQLGPDSLPREGVPTGQMRGPYTLPSQAYPGTQHTYWVYVPAQYDPSIPASLMILNDGQAFKNMLRSYMKEHYISGGGDFSWFCWVLRGAARFCWVRSRVDDSARRTNLAERTSSNEPSRT